MRVISGSARGHKLIAPDGLKTRPTTDRIKESLFNIIAPDLYGAVFLDLFSGSGGIGIEALSRGAEMAVFVDNGKKAIEAVEANLCHTKLKDKAAVYKTDVIEAIKVLSGKNMKFDIIFMDPPYSSGFYESVLREITLGGLLKEDGYIIAERSSEIDLPKVEGLKVFRTKDYKTSVMSFLTLEE